MNIFLSILLTLFFYLSCNGEGFHKTTYVKVPGGYAPISLIKKGDKVQVGNAHIKVKDVFIGTSKASYILIFGNGAQLLTDTYQRFFVYEEFEKSSMKLCGEWDDELAESWWLWHKNRGWLTADELVEGMELSINNEPLILKQKILQCKSEELYMLSLDPSMDDPEIHSYIVYPGVKVHNFPWEVGMQLTFSHDALLDFSSYSFSSLGVYGSIIVGGVIAVGATAKYAYDKLKPHFAAGFRVKPAKPEPECDPSNPVTCRYADIAYHNPHSSGWKSPSPKNGLKALHNSIRMSEVTYHRMGVSEGQIVQLMYSNNCEFHGYVVDWEKVDKVHQIKLIRAGLVDAKGRPIKS